MFNIESPSHMGYSMPGPGKLTTLIAAEETSHPRFGHRVADQNSMPLKVSRGRSKGESINPRPMVHRQRSQELLSLPSVVILTPKPRSGHANIRGYLVDEGYRAAAPALGLLTNTEGTKSSHTQRNVKPSTNKH